MKKIIQDITELYYYTIEGSGGTTYIPRNVSYSVSNNFYFNYPKRRDGKPDIRYGICKLHRLLKII